ncbi:LPS-assembly protein LptD [Salinispira pacifica]|uniref:LPS-assembly protein LptD n=1 Tax=Salinispira pacifica TaxID=1307761 RepID=V5WHF8_9SPIO|nr:LPS-assembly protein LptD [Salinispira pacifica]AHC15248.1 hypothetical protein L21SP2_1875 [Salinispira pacifica]
MTNFRRTIISVLLMLAAAPALWTQSSSSVTDFSSYSYEQLVEIAIENGLPFSGNRVVLEARLESLLAREEVQRTVIPESAASSSSVEQADTGSYVKRNGGNELELLGNVIIRVEDDAYSVVHRISADRIIFNDDLGQLSARGNVDYLMVGPNREDKFQGEDLLFILDDNETLFMDGGGETSSESDSEAAEIARQLGRDSQLTYRYSGEFITRNQDNVIILDRGVITSSASPSPYYRLRFKKLWILSPGEWGIEGARLLVGNIPVLALPFMYLPGNDVLFHPVVRYEGIRGYGINTTTYIVGKREAGDSPFSFLQMANEMESSGQSRMGLFLQPDDSPVPDTWAHDNLDMMKLFADVYSIRGVTLGMAVQRNSESGIEFDALTVLALTRELYRREDGSITAFYPESEIPVSSWHVSRFMDITLPFRYILDLSGELQSSWGRVSLGLPIYSDPYISDEFQTRSERMPWENILFGGSSETESGFTRSSMDWNLRFSLTPSMPVGIQPLISSLRLSNISTNVEFSTEELPGEQPGERTEASMARQDALNSPVLEQFVPSRVQFPSGALALSGTLLQLPGADTARSPRVNGSEEIPDDESSREESPEGRFPELLPPGAFPQDPPGEGDEKTEAVASLPGSVIPSESEGMAGSISDEFLVPRIDGEAVPGFSNNPAGEYRLSYSLSNNHFLALLMEEEDDSENETEDNGDNSNRSYYNFQNSLNASLTQSMGLVQSLGSLQSVIRYSNVYRRNYGFSGNYQEELQQSLQESALDQSRQNLTFSQTSGIKPLALLYTPVSLGISHNLSLKLWSRDVFPDGSFEDTAFSWDRENISGHKIDLNLSVPELIAAEDHQLSVSYQLPPLDQDLSLRYGLQAQGFNLGLGWGAAWKEDVWEYDNLTGSMSLSSIDWITPSVEIEVNGTEGRLEKTALEFSDVFDFYDAEFLLEYREQLELNQNRTAWIESGEFLFTPSRLNQNISVPLEAKGPEGAEFRLDSRLAWNHDFVKFTQSRADFQLSISYYLPEFMLLRISSKSSNSRVYRYFEGYSSRLGLERRSLFRDLLWSVNVFDNSRREAAFFNLDSYSAELLHDLGDWMLRLEYEWVPRQVTGDDGLKKIEIDNTLSFFLQWLPISELKNELDLTINSDEVILDY